MPARDLGLKECPRDVEASAETAEARLPLGYADFGLFFVCFLLVIFDCKHLLMYLRYSLRILQGFAELRPDSRSTDSP